MGNGPSLEKLQPGSSLREGEGVGCEAGLEVRLSLRELQLSRRAASFCLPLPQLGCQSLQVLPQPTSLLFQPIKSVSGV